MSFLIEPLPGFLQEYQLGYFLNVHVEILFKFRLRFISVFLPGLSADDSFRCPGMILSVFSEFILEFLLGSFSSVLTRIFAGSIAAISHRVLPAFLLQRFLHAFTRSCLPDFLQ